MPSLTKTQIEHAIKRLDERMQEYIERKMAPLGPKPEAPRLTFDQMVEMIRIGKAVLKPREKLNEYTDLTPAYTYLLNPEDQIKQDMHDAWKLALKKTTEEAEAIKQSVLDELIMSPDGKAALERIAAAFA